MPWERISSYVSRFRRFRPPEDAIPPVCARILSRALGTTISSANVSIKNRCLCVRGLDSATQSEIYLKQESLLGLIRAELGEEVVASIK